jgi:hypothetical protein
MLRGGAGLLLVLLALTLLMLSIKALSAPRRERPRPAASAPDPVRAVVDREEARRAKKAGLVPAPGSFGELCQHDVDDLTTALLLAIVADDIKAPLNELRFISVKEV